MDEYQIPVVPISEQATWGELPELLEEVLTDFGQEGFSVPPLVIFEPYKVSRIPDRPPTPSAAPDELVAVSIVPTIRRLVFEALERVGAREPKLPANPKAKGLKLEDNMPLKSIFRQMRELPATVFNHTLPGNGPDGDTAFFLRTRFTISELRHELEQPPCRGPRERRYRGALPAPRAGAWRLR